MFSSRIKIALLLLFLQCTVIGCSTSLVYNRLDWLITWYVDDYVDLSSAQKATLQAELQPTLNWHRQEELNNYISLLEKVENTVAEQVSAETVSAWTAELLDSYRRVKLNLVDVALEFGAELSDEQMQEFVASLWEKQAELKEKYLSRSDEDYVEDNYERISDNVSDYLGRLTDEQEAVLKSAAASLERLDYAWLQDRDEWLKRLQPLLNREPGWQAEIRILYQNRERYRSESYQRVFKHNMAILNQALADVLNQRSEKQQQTLTLELNEFKEELQTLMAYREDAVTPPQRKLL